MSHSKAGTLAVAALVTMAAGCASNSGRGAGIGGGSGIGYATGATVRRTIIAAAVGGVAGAEISRQMDGLAEELSYELPGATVQRFGEGIALTLPEGTLFLYGSDQLLPAAREDMHRVAASLAKYPGMRALIVGHTDSQGNAVFNADLSERRAQSAATVIAAEGIAPARIGTAGRGESEPIATNATEAGRQQNRRIEVAISADPATRRAGN